MQRLLFVIVIIYAIGITIILFVKNHRKYFHDIPALKELHKAELEIAPISEKIKMLIDIAKLEQNQTPWHEKSISTLGVIMFFSMLIATGIQAIDASIKTYRVESLRKEIDLLNSNQKVAEQLIADAASAIRTEYHRTGRSSFEGDRILRQRLAYLKEISTINHDIIIERYQIDMLLGNLDDAAALLDKNLGLLNDTVPADQLTLAQYYYQIGAAETARQLMSQIKTKLSSLSDEMKSSAMILNSALYPRDIDVYARSIGILWRMNTEDAKRRLENEILRLKAPRLIQKDY